MILCAFLRYRKNADLYDSVFRNYKKIAFFTLICCILLAIFSYVPYYAEPVIFLSALVSLSMGPSIGFMIPALLTLQLSLISEYSLYHTMFLMLMILVGSILDTECYGSKGKHNWLFYDTMLMCIATPFSCLFFYMDNEYIDSTVVIYAVVSAVMSCIGIMAATAYFGKSMFKKDRAQLVKILADDYLLRQQMNSLDPGYYRRSVFISDLAGQLASQIGADTLLAKAAGLYYRLGRLDEEESVEGGIRIALESEFPGELIWILYESGGKKRIPTSEVSGIVYIIDCVYTAIENSPQAKSAMDFELIIHKVTNTLSTEGKLDRCGISMNSFLKIRDSLIGGSAEYGSRIRKQNKS